MDLKTYKKYYPKSHLKNLTDIIFKKILNSDSVGIYGMVGSGREFLLPHIAAYLGSFSKDKWLQVVLNADLLKSLDLEAISDLAIRQIIEQVPSLRTYPFSASNNIGFRIHHLYLLLQECQRLGYFLVFMINRFENWVENKKIIRFLDGLKDLCFSRLPILLSINLKIFKKNNKFICSSLAPNLYRVKPLTKKDIDTMMKCNAKVFKWELNKEIIKKCTYYSGGNPGLIKYIHRVLSEEPSDVSVESLLAKESIQYKMEVHTKELADLLGLEDVNLSDLKKSKYKEKLTKSGYLTKGKLFSPLLEAYFERLKKSKRLEHDDLLNSLSKQEYEVFTRMSKGLGSIFSLDDIADILWGVDVKKKFSLWAVYRIMSSLRQKIVDSEYELSTIRGRGYKLEIKPK